MRYLLEGSVRKSANRLRIAGQLIDASSGAHLWADRFEGAVEDVFEVQDQVTTRVVGAIAPTIATASCALAGRNEEAMRLMARLLEVDPALRISNLQNVLGPYRHRSTSPNMQKVCKRQAYLNEGRLKWPVRSKC